jgi:hypothetical protein
MNRSTTLALEDVSTWRDLIAWAWASLQEASPWLSPLLWTLLFFALIVFWVRGKGWQKTKAIVKWMQSAVKTVDQFVTLTEDIGYIKGQLQNNGGSTVKDEVQALGKTVARIEKKVDGAARTAREAKTAAGETQKLLRDHINNPKT